MVPYRMKFGYENVQLFLRYESYSCSTGFRKETDYTNLYPYFCEAIQLLEN